MKKILSLVRANIHILLLTFLSIGFLIGIVLYVSKTRQYPQWDEHHYVSLSRSIYNILGHPSSSTWQQILKVSDFRQPLYPFMIALILRVVGPEYSYSVSLLLNGLFFVITIFAIYGSVRCFGDKTCAFLASCLYAGMGFPLFYVHFAYSETAATMWTALTLFFLFKSNGFSNRHMSLFAALTCTGGLLTRWVTPIFVIPAVLWELYLLCNLWKKEKKNQRSHRLSNALLFITLSVLLPCLFYYLPNFQPFYAYISTNSSLSGRWVSQYKGSEYSNPLSIKTIVYYMNTISQNTVFYFTLFLLGCWFCFFRIKKYGGLLLSFIVPYSIFSAVFLWKDDRFIVPLYPIITVISVIPLIMLKRKRIRFFLIVYILLLSFFSFFGCAWGLGPMGKRGLTDIVLPPVITHPRRLYLTSMVWPPVKEYINADQVIETIIKNSSKKPVTVSILISHEQLNNALYSIEQYYTYNTIILSFAMAPVDSRGTKALNDNFVVIRNEPEYTDPPVALCFAHALQVFSDTYILVGEVTVPSDMTIVHIYKKEKNIDNQMLTTLGSPCSGIYASPDPKP